MQDWLWGLAGGFAVSALIAGFADRRRVRRSDPDAVGWVPWPQIVLISMAGVIVCAAFAVRG